MNRLAIGFLAAAFPALPACSDLSGLLRTLADASAPRSGSPGSPPAQGNTGDGNPASPRPAPQPTASPPAESQIADPEQLLTAWLQALTSGTEDQAAVAVLPFVHKSLKNSSGTALSSDVRQFSFHKAYVDAKFYALPVVVTRIRENQGTTGIGHGDQAERGRIKDYFIGRKDASTGMPAPVPLFFPESGAPPKVSYMGNL